MQRREFCFLNLAIIEQWKCRHSQFRRSTNLIVIWVWSRNGAQAFNVNTTLLLIGLQPYRILIPCFQRGERERREHKSLSSLQSHHQCAANFMYILAMLMPSFESPWKRLHSSPPAIFRAATIFPLCRATRCAFELMLARDNKMFTTYICATYSLSQAPRDNCLHFWWDYVNNKSKWEKHETLTSINVEGVRCCVGNFIWDFNSPTTKAKTFSGWGGQCGGELQLFCPQLINTTINK